MGLRSLGREPGMVGLDVMRSPKAGRVTIPLTPSMRGRVDSRPVCCVPWVQWHTSTRMLWRKLPRLLVLRIV